MLLPIINTDNSLSRYTKFLTDNGSMRGFHFVMSPILLDRLQPTYSGIIGKDLYNLLYGLVRFGNLSKYIWPHRLFMGSLHSHCSQIHEERVIRYLQQVGNFLLLLLMRICGFPSSIKLNFDHSYNESHLIFFQRKLCI